jgi:hypothetical protein
MQQLKQGHDFFHIYMKKCQDKMETKQNQNIKQSNDVGINDLTC